MLTIAFGHCLWTAVDSSFMNIVMPACSAQVPLGVGQLPSKSTLTPSRPFAAMALIVFAIAACRDVSELTIELAVAVLVALMTTTTRSPAVCARLIMSTRFWLFQPVHELSVVLKLTSLLTLMPKYASVLRRLYFQFAWAPALSAQ